MPASPADLVTKSVEWYTPAPLAAHIAAFMGGIDVDPCADPDHAIPAREHYTAADNGLARDWYGRVFCNPPYGRGIEEWVAKAVTSPCSQVILLVPSYTGSGWFQRYILPRFSVCWYAGRIKFSGCKDAARFDSVIAYRGWQSDAFAAAFARYGPVTHPATIQPREGAAHVASV